MSGSNLRVGGVVSLTINSQVWNVVGPLKYRPTFVERETARGQSAVEGYTEMPQSGLISAVLRDRGDTTVQSLNAMTNVPITGLLANGKAVTGFGMWQTGDIQVDTKEGTFDVTFEGADVYESTARAGF